MNDALATVELLELILLEIDTQTLLTSANRVCKFWNNVIQHSAQLQAALFFRPVDTLTFPERHDHQDNGNNKETPVAPTTRCTIRTNTLLLCRFQEILHSSRRDAPLGRANPAVTTTTTTNNNEPFSKDDAHGAQSRLARPEASWRRMLLQQPPVRQLGIWRLDTGCALSHGFTNQTEILRFDDDDDHHHHNNDDEKDKHKEKPPPAAPLTMASLVALAHTLPAGYAWELVTGTAAARRERWEAREKQTFFFLKASGEEKRALEALWTTSDVVVKLTRWLGGI